MGGAPRQGAPLPSPSLLLSLKGGRLLAEDVVTSPQGDLPGGNGVNHPQPLTLGADWTNDGKVMVQV